MEKTDVMEILGPDPKTSDEGDESDPMDLISQELIEAVHARNTTDVANALKAAFQYLDAEPHSEGPHED